MKIEEFNDNIVVLGNGEYQWKVLRELLIPYFPNLCDKIVMEAYFAKNLLGGPDTKIVYWDDQPIVTVSVFPFPLLIRGRESVCGKLEAGAKNPKYRGVKARQDFFKILSGEIVKVGRMRAFPLLFGLPTEVSAKAHARAGYTRFNLPYVMLKWIIRPSGLARLIGARFKMLVQSVQEDTAQFNIWSSRWLTNLLSIGDNLWGNRQITPSGQYDIEAIDIHELPQYVNYYYNTSIGDMYITASRNTKYFASRVNGQDRYRCLIFKKNIDIKGVAIVDIGNEATMSVLDICPPLLECDKECWRSLYRYALINTKALFMIKRMCMNNPVETEASKIRDVLLPCIKTYNSDLFIVKTLDSSVEHAKRPEVWYGTAMLAAGF